MKAPAFWSRTIGVCSRPPSTACGWRRTERSSRSKAISPTTAGLCWAAPNRNKDTSAKPRPPPSAKPKREPQPIKREIAALEDKMTRFQDLLRRVDEALTQASARNGDGAKIAELAAKRAELERALTATEAAWFELTAEVEQI